MNTSRFPGDSRPQANHQEPTAAAAEQGSRIQNVLIILAIGVAVVVTVVKIWELMAVEEKRPDKRLERLEARRKYLAIQLQLARKNNLSATDLTKIELDSVMVADSISLLAR